MTKQLILHTDGGSRGNPGPAALGYVLTAPSGEVVEERGVYLGVQTNNYAEYQALVYGLKAALAHEATEVIVRMDSELIVRQMTGQYKIKHPTMQAIAAEVKALLPKFTSVKFEHVRREFNKQADAMVNEALDAEVGPRT